MATYSENLGLELIEGNDIFGSGTSQGNYNANILDDLLKDYENNIAKIPTIESGILSLNNGLTTTNNNLQTTNSNLQTTNNNLSSLTGKVNSDETILLAVRGEVTGIKKYNINGTEKTLLPKNYILTDLSDIALYDRYDIPVEQRQIIGHSITIEIDVSDLSLTSNSNIYLSNVTVTRKSGGVRSGFAPTYYTVSNNILRVTLTNEDLSTVLRNDWIGVLNIVIE